MGRRDRGVETPVATPSTRFSTARPRRTPFGCPWARANGDVGSAGTAVSTLVPSVGLARLVLVGLGVFAKRRRRVGRAASASPGVSSAPLSPAAATDDPAATLAEAVTAHFARADGPTRT